MKRLSHLAYIALGVVAQNEPCSAYKVMMAFQKSSSSYYSGSAGAIYPLLRRLASAGLVSVERAKRGKREKKTYTVTAEGRRQFHKWAMTIDHNEDVAFVVDLLRTRVSLMEAHSKAERRKFFKEAKKQVAVHLKNLKRKLSLGDGLTECDMVAVRGVIMGEEARLKWLLEAEKQLT